MARLDPPKRDARRASGLGVLTWVLFAVVALADCSERSDPAGEGIAPSEAASVGDIADPGVEALRSGWQAANHFADPPGAPQGKRSEPSMLGNDTRPVLFSPVRTSLLQEEGIGVPSDALLFLTPLLPAKLSGYRRVVVKARMRQAQRWLSQPPCVAAVEIGPGGGERVRVRLALPQGIARRADPRVDVRLDVTGLVENGRTHHQTEPVAIPPGARLDFALGIDSAASGGGPVEFAIRACRLEVCVDVFREILDPGSGGVSPSCGTSLGPKHDAATRAGWREHSVLLEAARAARSAGDTEWQQRSVSLERPLAELRASKGHRGEPEDGPVVAHFRFETLSATETRGARPDPPYSLPLWANPTLLVRAPRDTRPNVVLFSLDTLRADHLELYGYPRDTAPFIAERFGRRGTVVANLVAAAAMTGPSHMSLFTSLQPSVHGVGDGRTTLPHGVVTLAEALRAAGYETVAFTENAALSIATGFARGFDRYVENASARVAEGHVRDTFGQALEWLSLPHERPFFLFVHTYQVHRPYSPPEPYRGLFQGAAPGVPLPHPDLPAGYDPSDYDREIRFVDDEMRRFFDALSQTGLADETLVILTSDHGEEFLEHGALEHGNQLHAEVTHVPLLFAGPGIPPQGRVAEPVGHIDLMPTILEWLGVSPSVVAPLKDQMMGRSFAGLLRSGGGESARRALFSEATNPIRNTAQGKLIAGSGGLAVRLGDRKLVRQPRRRGGARSSYDYAYYDLKADPGERNDLYATQSHDARDLRLLLDGYAGEMASRRKALRSLSPSNSEPNALQIDLEHEEKLRALGYLEDLD